MKYVVTTKVRFFVEAESQNEAVHKALDADLSENTILDGVTFHGIERLDVCTRTMDDLKHQAIVSGQPPIKWNRIK